MSARRSSPPSAAASTRPPDAAASVGGGRKKRGKEIREKERVDTNRNQPTNKSFLMKEGTKALRLLLLLLSFLTASQPAGNLISEVFFGVINLECSAAQELNCTVGKNCLLLYSNNQYHVVAG